MKIEIKLLEKQIESLSGTDNEKGETVEYIVSQVLYELGADEVYKYNWDIDKQEQINVGDFRIKANNKVINAEVKTSHQFNRIDKQAMDIYYFRYDRRYGLLPYYQGRSSGTYLGWVYLTQADWLICFNPISYKMYIIKEYQKLKEQIINDTENYINSLKKCEKTWYMRGHNNYINDYLEGSVKKDTCKDSLIVNLKLSEDSFKHYNVKYDIIDIKLKEVRRMRQHEKSPISIGRRKRTCSR